MPGAGEMDMPAGIARPPLTFYSKPSSSSTLGPAHLCNETHVVGDVVGVTGGPKYCSLVLRTHRPRHWYVGWCPCRVSLPCSAHRTGDEAMAGGDERAIGCEPRRADGAVPTTPHTDYPVKLASRRARLLGRVVTQVSQACGSCARPDSQRSAFAQHAHRRSPPMRGGSSG